MMTPNQKKLGMLTVLLVVLGATLVIGRNLNKVSDSAAVQSGQKPASGVAAVSTQGDARIRLDLLDKPKSDENLGKNNLFQYRITKPPEPVLRPGQTAGSPQLPPDFVPPPPKPLAPPPPPPPPPIPLKYVGFATVEPNSKALIATLMDDQHHPFSAVEGDVFMGRYRIARITETQVEVEDLQITRRQTLTIVKQP
jgi:hypothetical protein